MPRCYRLLFLAYLGLIAPLEVRAQTADSTRTPSRGPTVQSGSPSQQADQNGSAKREPLEVRIIEDPKESERTEQRERSDLEAQWAAANAAREQAVLALWQIWIGVAGTMVAAVGLIFIAVTLYYTRRAVKEASLATQAANDAVAITREIGERQLRAYVHVTRIGLEQVNNDECEPAVRVSYKNFGQSPAQQVINKFHIIFKGGGEIPFKRRPTEKEESGFTLGPTQERHSVMPAPLDNLHNFREKLTQGTTTMFVKGEITYVDVFDRPRFTRYHFRLHIEPEGLADTTSFLVCEDGNECD